MARPTISSLADFRRNRLTREQVNTASQVLRTIALGRMPGEAALSRGAVLRRLLAALAMAIVLWVYITQQDNPVKSQQFPLTVEVRNLPKGLAIRSVLGQVKVTVSGLQSSLNSAQSLIAYVDLRDVAVSGGEATVNVQLQGKRPNLQYTVSPSTVSLTFLRQVSKSVKVTFTPQSSPPQSVAQLPGAQVSPLVLTVSGPEDGVNRVGSAQVTAPLDQVAPTNASGAPFTVTLQLAPQLLDAQGRPISDPRLTISKSLITVKLQFQQLFETRVMSVAPAISSYPAAGYILGPQAPQPFPLTVLVLGSPQALGTQQVVTTAPIDIHTLTTSMTLTTTLLLPPGVVAITGQNGALDRTPGGPAWHVHVTITTFKANDILPARVVVDHLAHGLQAKVTTPWAQVFVTGAYVDVIKLGPLLAHLNASGLGPGVYDVTPTVGVPRSLGNYAISPTKIHVVISHKRT